MFVALNMNAQDKHFSQFYNMPLSVNPALSGHIEGTYRLGLIYRNQWGSITQGGVYSTPGAAFDMNFKLKEESRNSLGFGLMFLNDQSGGGDLSDIEVQLSAAYHMSLDKKEKTYLSFGLQGGFLNKRLNSNLLIFESMFDNNGNIVNPSNENFNNTQISGADLRAGLVMSFYPNDKSNFKFGGSYMHLIPTSEIFLAGTSENNLPGRLVAFAQATFGFKNPKLSLMPELLFMNQASVNEINFTTNLGYAFNPDMQLIIGGGYRVGDAAIVDAGIVFKGMRLMASYDLNISQLQPASRTQGGYEITVGYIGRTSKPVKPDLPCIRFY